MKCLLANDNCKTCTFNKHALTLHGIQSIEFTQDIPENDNTQHLPILMCLNQYDRKTHSIHASRLVLTGDTLPDSNDNIHFLRSPFKWSDLFATLIRIQSVINKCVNDAGNQRESSPLDRIAGSSKEINLLKQHVIQVSASDATVLLTGESGTGKDLTASTIHALSPRRHNPFIPVNCGAIPADLIESELFGHAKGAFTGALNHRIGRFEAADGGTLFLDEIGDMPLNMQVKLLRVLQDRKIQPLGSNEFRHIDVRIIAATNKNLENLVNTGHFREDLFFRICVFPIYSPSLRERRDDIEQIARLWIKNISSRHQGKIEFTDESWKRMRDYPWPGNIRELQNFIERMFILYPNSAISSEEIEPYFSSRKQFLVKFDPTEPSKTRKPAPAKRKVSIPCPD